MSKKRKTAKKRRKAVGAEVTVLEFGDDPDNCETRYVSFGKKAYCPTCDPHGHRDPIGDEYGVPDGHIYYYAEGVKELRKLRKSRNGIGGMKLLAYDVVYEGEISRNGYGFA